MIATTLLRVGQHVKVGSIHPTFEVPKHLSKISQIGEDYITCEDVRYSAKEIEGLPITAEMLEKNDFKISQLRETRFFYIDQDTKARVTIDIRDGSVSAMGKEHIQRTGVLYLHQLESIIADADIDLQIQL